MEPKVTYFKGYQTYTLNEYGLYAPSTDFQKVNLTGRWKIINNNGEEVMYVERVFDIAKYIGKKYIGRNWLGFKKYENMYETVIECEWVSEKELKYKIEYPVQECGV